MVLRKLKFKNFEGTSKTGHEQIFVYDLYQM